MTTRIGIGPVMYALRTGAGMSQRQVACKVGVNVATISHWERGLNAPPLDKFLTFCEAVGADPARTVGILTGSGRDTPTPHEETTT